MTNNTQVKKPSLRLTMSDREDVRDAIRDPLMGAAKDKLRDLNLAISMVVFNSLFTDAEHKAIKVLAAQLVRPDKMEVVSDAPLKEGQRWADTYRLTFDGTQPIPYPQMKRSAPAKLLSAFDKAKDEYDAEVKRINALLAELNGVLLSSTTRANLAVRWPAIYDLMGAEWVDASKEPNTLPAVFTANITQAVAQLKKAA